MGRQNRAVAFLSVPMYFGFGIQSHSPRIMCTDCIQNAGPCSSPSQFYLRLMRSLLVKDLEFTGLPEGSGPEEPPLVVFLSTLAFK